MRYYGQFDPPVDKILHDTYFDGQDRGFFIECGAFDGFSECSCRLFEELGWKGINVEASPGVFKALMRNRPNSLNVNVALSDKAGTAVFTDAYLPNRVMCTNGSLQHTPEQLEDLKKYNINYDKVSVPTTTYAQLIKDYNVAFVDLMVLDVEGHELEVLSGMEGCPVLPKVMCVELTYVGIDNLTKKMESLGYTFDFIQHNNAHYVWYPK